MRNVILPVLAVLGACMLLPKEVSAQSTARITLSGGITPGTCSVADINQPMPKVSADLLPSTRGVPESYTPFNVSLRNCAGVKNAKVQFGFAADADSVSNDTFANKSATGPANISIWLQARPACGPTGDGNTILPSEVITMSVNNASTLDYPVCAQYWRSTSDPIISGDVTTTFQLTITYE